MCEFALFTEFRKLFNRFFSSLYCPCTTPRALRSVENRLLELAPWLPMRCMIFPPLLSLRFTLGSVPCPVFTFASLFPGNIRSIFNAIRCIFHCEHYDVYS